MHRGKGMKFVGDSRIKSNHRMVNLPKDYSEYPGKTEAFWPNFLLKEWMVGSVFLIGYLLLTVAHPSPLEGQADPTNTGYIPLPDWYFLFMYQLLKYTYASGDFNVIGAVVMPGLAFMALALVPFMDTTPERRPSKRPVPIAMMLLALASMIYLTWESVANHDWKATEKQAQIVSEIDKESAGYQIYSKSACISCHGETLRGGAGGPNISNTIYSSEEIAHIAKNGFNKMPAGLWSGSDEDLKTLTEFIDGLTKKEIEHESIIK